MFRGDERVMTDSEKERQLSRKGNIGTVSSDRLVHVDVQHCNQESASFATQSSSCVGERYNDVSNGRPHRGRRDRRDASFTRPDASSAARYDRHRWTFDGQSFCRSFLFALVGFQQ